MLKEFKDFVSRGNMLDLAIGVVIGAAFGKVIKKNATMLEKLKLAPLNLLQQVIKISSKGNLSHSFCKHFSRKIGPRGQQICVNTTN